jgi:hypothetical protein
MLTLSLIWLGLGAVIGLAALAAQLAPPRWGGWRWLALPALGAVAALLGGWLGALLFDRVQASLVAVWVCIPVVVLTALLAHKRQAA